MKIINWLDTHLERYILIFLSILAVIIVSLQVFMRFIIGSSLVWSEELARYIFIWMIYIGISYGVKKQRHIKVDAMLMLFKARGKVILNIIGNLLFLIFCLVIIIYSFKVVEQIFAWGRLSPALSLPMGYIYCAPLVGMILTCIRLIQQMVSQIQRIRLGEEEKEEQEFEQILKQR